MPANIENTLKNPTLDILHHLAQRDSPRPQPAILVHELARDLIVCGFGGCD